jgi:hypothetical protein
MNFVNWQQCVVHDCRTMLQFWLENILATSWLYKERDLVNRIFIIQLVSGLRAEA